LEIRRRAADIPQNLARRGLLVQSLLKFSDESGVLDRDDGLLGVRLGYLPFQLRTVGL